MNDFVRFGSPDLIEIAARWMVDAEPRERLPREGGWSTGDLQITVGHQVLTARRFKEADSSYLSWYLYPVLDWLVSQWTAMFHEEAYAWPEKSGAPAAAAVFAALGRSIASSDEAQREEYRSVQAWWMRHALRAADPSALYPDLCLRRLGDDVEISWAGRQPVHVPEGFALTLSPGYATFAVAAVAEPLWQFLQWGIETAPVVTQQDRTAVEELSSRFQRLKKTPLEDLELKHLGQGLQCLLREARAAVSIRDSNSLVKDIPAIASFDPAVLMFGGLNPSIGSPDAVRLMQFLAKHQDGSEAEALARLVDDRGWDPTLAPYEQGYELAEEVRDQLGIAPAEPDVNVRRLLHDLNVKVEEATLDTESVRGVAVAGPGFSPAILVNMASAFNRSREGQNFTLAHEFCHILFDRTRAKRLSHVSGAWTTPRTEKRANAFAAMFLASRTAVRKAFFEHGAEKTREMARTLQLGHSSLVEHLYNLGLIDEATRERLRLNDAA